MCDKRKDINLVYDQDYKAVIKTTLYTTIKVCVFNRSNDVSRFDMFNKFFLAQRAGFNSLAVCGVLVVVCVLLLQAPN